MFYQNDSYKKGNIISKTSRFVILRNEESVHRHA